MERINVKFKLLRSRHIIVLIFINGARGRFLLDTGASATCVDISGLAKFNIKAALSKDAAHGTAGKVETSVSGRNVIRVGKRVFRNRRIICFSLAHVNDALSQMGEESIDGILGADILIFSKAVIDYSSKTLSIEPIRL